MKSEDQQNEVWRLCHDDNNYQVSNTGRVRRFVSYNNVRLKECLKPKVGSSPYYFVCLSNPIKDKYRMIHALVARAFIGPRPVGMVINHKDGDKKNNNDWNLEYCTQKQNMLHAKKSCLWNIDAVRTRGIKRFTGQSNPKAKMTNSKAKRIKMFILSNPDFRNVVIAKKFKVSIGIISNIKNNQTWKHVSI